MERYFGYERAASGLWIPVCYYGGRPSQPNPEFPMRTELVEIPADCLDESGDPLFGRLKSQFPAPGAE